MITTKYTPNAQQKEYYGLSTDTKPTEARNGDKFTEINTGKTFLYDETGEEWDEQPASGGGGGGGGGSSDLSTATLTITCGDSTAFNSVGIFGAIISEDEGAMKYQWYPADQDTPESVSVALYNNVADFKLEKDGMVDGLIIGDAVINGTVLHVFGDATIVFSQGK